MQSFIAPRVLIVNGKPSPCKCTGFNVCEYCVQANLILWEKEEHPEKKISENLIASIEQKGVRKTARLLNMRHATISHWIQTKNIPQKYIEKIKSVT
jgi:hypothetical protein